MDKLPKTTELHIAVMYRLLGLCRKYDIGISQLAKRSEVPLTTIKNILNGASLNPGINTLNRLCGGFGITLEEFFSDEVFAEINGQNRRRQ
ncbi:MAG: helix-turn-helix domain-containing protein [Bacillota bacterium]|jgi:transcriptional regulator with XRE-family HTH domain